MNYYKLNVDLDKKYSFYKFNNVLFGGEEKEDIDVNQNEDITNDIINIEDITNPTYREIKQPPSGGNYKNNIGRNIQQMLVKLKNY